MRGSDPSLFVINDEKYRNIPDPEVRVGPPESSKSDKRCQKSDKKHVFHVNKVEKGCILATFWPLSGPVSDSF